MRAFKCRGFFKFRTNRDLFELLIVDINSCFDSGIFETAIEESALIFVKTFFANEGNLLKRRSLAFSNALHVFQSHFIVLVEHFTHHNVNLITFMGLDFERHISSDIIFIF